MEKQYSGGQRAMTLTDPPARNYTDHKKAGQSNYRQILDAQQEQRRYHYHMQHQRVLQEQQRTSSLQKKFPMIKLDQTQHGASQNGTRIAYGKMTSTEEGVKGANPKCPLHGVGPHYHGPGQPAFHKSNSHEVNYLIQQTMRQQSGQNRLAKSPIQKKQ